MKIYTTRARGETFIVKMAKFRNIEESHGVSGLFDQSVK